MRASAMALVALAFHVAAASAQSPASCDPRFARAASVQGAVESSRPGGSPWQAVQINDSLCPGDTIRVGERGRADIALLDQSVLRLNAGSTLTLEPPKATGAGVVSLLRGAVHFLSRGPRSLEVNTPFTIAGVRGTEFTVSVEAERTLLTVFEGAVLAENAAGSVLLRDGQSGVAETGRAPVLRTVVRPRDAVQWTLYYPPVVDAPAGEQDARTQVYRAQGLLALGSVEEARRLLERVRQTPEGASLLSVVTLVQGDRDGALSLARSAVAAGPRSATAHIALSYAEQARFDLKAARASAEQAVALEPKSALAWARLAELQSSFGELAPAVASAQRAAELQPGLSRSQTVLGFAQLTSVDTRAARQSFDKAIRLDQGDPLPRLGLGLAMIREGKLHEGSREIEIAASLDPANSLVRSYLGKAYYEERRSPLDQRELAMAKSLDPLDPTPWFYDAISKQADNRPVEALQDLQEAAERNDNRAVYRSRLLLDSDAAARSASLARVYSDLGFEQRALVEGWRALSFDAGNFSAHRFLADAYSVLPRHQIARVSELLQSQLLQPATMAPLQPQLAESRLLMIGASGPGLASFNELNPLFNSDGVSALVGGFAGSHRSYGADAIVAGISGKASFSFGLSRFQTDGIRVNNDQHDRIGNAFVQYDFSPQTSVQAEYRARATDIGDLQQRFFPENVFRGLRNTQDIDTVRLGARHAFGPDSTLLGSFIHQKARFGTVFDEPGAFTRLRIPQRSSGAEVQHLWRSEGFGLRSGGGFVKISGQIDALNIIDFGPPVGVVTDQSSTRTDIRHANAYAYGDIRLTRSLTAIVGASYDMLKGDFPGGDQNHFNPKLGVIWDVTPATTLRAAAFKVIKRTLVTNQTLEPTQVAGFNQFYDDGNLTRSKRYGAAVDHKFSRTMFGGAELSKRDLDVVFLDSTINPANPPARVVAWTEHLARGYLFWTPRPSLALRAEYMYERFRRTDDFSEGAKSLDIHRVPLGVNWFGPGGFGAGVTATWWLQKGAFEELTFPPTFRPGRDTFWLVDAALRYRLPQRKGVVALGVRNLLDKQFNAFDIDPSNPTIQPRRMVFVSATFALP